jgi:CubicO group peptidase (beta-lactamase class C family)
MKGFGALAVGTGLVWMTSVCAAQAPKAQVLPTTGPRLTQPTHSNEAQPVPTVTVFPSSPPVVSDKNHPTAFPLDTADLEAFFDGILPLQLERSDIAGASVLVMRDGQVLLQKGYGVADEKSKRPVDPETTIFRLASISKLFTWMSIMQLEEQGKLNLDTDVNQYLDFQIKPAFDKPITLRNLMTHTGGFEESISDILLTDPKKAVSLRDILIANQPKRLFPPGAVPAYSNYGVGLASYIVQRLSGEPFEQYVKEHIFTPLGMVHSTFYQPVPQALAKLPSEGYRSDTTKPPVGFEIFNPVGAGGLSSTAADMGRFGRMLLGGGELDGKRILKPETLALMWTPQFQASNQMPPICMGFYQNWRNNLRWIGHEGDLIAFHSLFFVEPTQKIVLFVSYNSAGGGDEPRPEIIDFFSDRYFPNMPKQVFMRNYPAEMRQIAGTYQATRRADSTKLALGNLFGQRTLSVNKDGVLTGENLKDLRGHTVKWKAIGKDLWQADGEQARLFAIRDGSGKVVRVAVNFPGVQFQRVVWYENAKWVLPALVGSLLVLAAVVLASLWRALRRIFLRKRARLTPQPGTAWLSWGPRLASFGWLILLGTIGGYLAAAGDDQMPPNPEWFRWFTVLNWATGVALLLSLFAVIAAIRIWQRDPLRWITRVKFTLVGVACALLSWWAIHWNLIGPAHRI